MNKVIEKILKGIAWFYIVCIVILVISIIMLIWWISTPQPTVLDGQKYASIEELHAQYVQKVIEQYDPERDVFPGEFIGYVAVGDKWVVLSICANKPTEVQTYDEIYAYLVGEVTEGENTAYVLLPGSAWFSLDSEDVNVDYYMQHESYYFQAEIEGESCSIGFFCKDVNETGKIYFDNTVMQEREMTNPVTGEPFILCYGKSEVTYNFFQKIFTRMEDRHTLELRF